MALTELQLPNKTEFYSNLRDEAVKIKLLMAQWKHMAEFLEDIDTSDLDAMGVASGQVRTDLTNFRVIVKEVVDFFNGESTTQTYTPSTIIDKIRPKAMGKVM